jgi:hypothetical protein
MRYRTPLGRFPPAGTAYRMEERRAWGTAYRIGIEEAASNVSHGAFGRCHAGDAVLLAGMLPTGTRYRPEEFF